MEPSSAPSFPGGTASASSVAATRNIFLNEIGDSTQPTARVFDYWLGGVCPTTFFSENAPLYRPRPPLQHSGMLRFRLAAERAEISLNLCSDQHRGISCLDSAQW